MRALKQCVIRSVEPVSTLIFEEIVNCAIPSLYTRCEPGRAARATGRQNEEEQVGQAEPELKPEINQSPDELGVMSEEQLRFIMAERQEILRALCHKITVYTDSRIILGGLIEVKDGAAGATAPRTIWDKKHADHITFVFDFALT